MKNNKNNSKHHISSGVQAIYAVFVGLLIVLFFGLGISAFYNEPKPPSYPEVVFTEGKPNESDEIIMKKYQDESDKFQTDMALYSRNVSIITIILSITVLFIGLFVINNISIISNGVLIGGIFTLIYSIIRGFMADDIRYRFVVVTIGLIISFALGYIKFVRPNRAKSN